VGVDGYPEGRDAAALGEAISEATGAATLLVAVHPDPLVVAPEGANWTSLRRQASDELLHTRDTFVPNARLKVLTDQSVPRALHRVVQQDHRDLLVLGSSRHARAGHVRIGKRTRQLLCHFECRLAVASRGLHEQGALRIETLGVGYDGSAEAELALRWAGGVAAGAGARLVVLSVVDDRLPAVGWGRVWIGDIMSDWIAVVEERKQKLCHQAKAVVESTGATVESRAVDGRPADALLALSAELDLLVIGSRRWGPAARVLLGSTGEAVMHDAACSVVAVPRPTVSAGTGPAPAAEGKPTDG
jgi:nucleotide-binding universal stress UspA family protein